MSFKKIFAVSLIISGLFMSGSFGSGNPVDERSIVSTTQATRSIAQERSSFIFPEGGANYVGCTFVQQMPPIQQVMPVRELESQSVAGHHLRNESISSDKIVRHAVTSEKIQDYAIISNKIKNESITKEKLAPNVRDFLTPVGVILPYAGHSAPPYWFLCDGRAICRTTYHQLFSVINTTYGAGNGVTTFNVPDLRGRSIFGIDNMGGIPANRVTNSTVPSGIHLGTTGGKESCTLTVQQIPPHSHVYHTGSGEQTRKSGRAANAHNSDIIQTINTNITGGGQPHSIMPPFMALNYIIKY